MNTTKRQSVRRQGGSAFILVVVVTVLLAVIGLMFVMVARVGEMGSSAVVDNADLDAAVQTVVSRIHTALVADLFGADDVIGSDGPHYTWPGVARGDDPLTGDRIVPWLADLEPNSLNSFHWEHITDLLAPDNPTAFVGTLPSDIIPDNPETVVPGTAADAAGDGVADSIWIRLPNASTSRGKPVFAAIRIIDNCAMLNLNTANCFQINTVSGGAYDGWFYYNQLAGNTVLHNEVNTSVPANRLYFKDGGRYLSEVNYASFLRGSGTSIDNLYGILAAKRFAFLNPTTGNIVSQLLPPDLHQVLMKIENPKDIPTVGSTYNLFDIGDELEIRNRHLLTSRVLARFESENVAYHTFDYGRGDFGVGGWNVDLRVKRTPCENLDDLGYWKIRLNPANFDGGHEHANYYDRRHISTFYSFDRPLRSGRYPLLDAALGAVADPVRRREIEAVFRPLGHRPIDLRWITSTDNPDRITANTPAARRNILHLLYAFRAFYMEQGNTKQAAAKKSAQITANLIDFLDDTQTASQGPFWPSLYGTQENPRPTFITEAMVNQMLSDVSGGNPLIVGNPVYAFGLEAAETVYGYERQPFISEIYCYRQVEGPTAGQVSQFALELVNPYPVAISLDGWRISIDSHNYTLSGTAYTVPAATGGTPGQFGRLTIWAGTGVPVSGQHVNHANFGLWPHFQGNSILRLERPDPAAPSTSFIVVDQTRQQQAQGIFLADGVRVSKRDDNGWKFTNNAAYAPVDAVARLGRHNDIADGVVTVKGYQLPVANDENPIARLADFIKVAFVSNQKGGTDPNTITEQIAAAADEADIRYDMETAPELLDYICFLNRPDKGSLPGRININTAALHVIAAAIPPQLVMTDTTGPSALDFAQAIVDNRPYQRVSDLLEIGIFKQYAQTGAPNVGDQGVEGDFEERDWIVSRLANIFTVRSDTFTAYILVRLGDDGPQRRMIAIFDRSQVWTPSDHPRLVALHPVPEAR